MGMILLFVVFFSPVVAAAARYSILTPVRAIQQRGWEIVLH
jgi:hypothetical protein